MLGLVHHPFQISFNPKVSGIVGLKFFIKKQNFSIFLLDLVDLHIGCH